MNITGKKILIISYYYPPANFVGAERIASFARHLHKFGVYPIIVTRNWNPNQTNTYEKIHENSFKHNVFDTHEEYYMPYHRSWRDRLFDRKGFLFSLLRRFLTAWELFVSSFWVSALPYRNLYIKSRELLTLNSDISVVIVSGSPFESFHFGYLLKKEFPHIHWIPGYRDEWTTFQGLPPSGFLNSLLHKLNIINERKWTGNVSAFMSVSDFWVQRISNFINKPGFKVMNGFENFVVNQNVSRDCSEFIITYNGTIYPEQDFMLFRNVLKRICEKYHSKTKLILTFYGLGMQSLEKSKIQQLFSELNIELNIFPRIDKTSLVDFMLKSDLLLLTSYGHIKGWYPVKMFDYLMVNRPILLCPTDDADMADFILKTKSGLASSDEDDCFDYLAKLIDLKLKGISSNIDRDELRSNFYTREHQASILASHLHNLKELKS